MYRNLLINCLLHYDLSVEEAEELDLEDVFEHGEYDVGEKLRRRAPAAVRRPLHVAWCMLHAACCTVSGAMLRVVCCMYCVACCVPNVASIQ
jgi:hypothetical protein